MFPYFAVAKESISMQILNFVKTFYNFIIKDSMTHLLILFTWKKV